MKIHGFKNRSLKRNWNLNRQYKISQDLHILSWAPSILEIPLSHLIQLLRVQRVDLFEIIPLMSFIINENSNKLRFMKLRIS
jgi:hypothetical protein